MKNLFVTDITVGQVLQNVAFAITEKKLGVDKNGKQFLDLTLADKTGQLRAKIWPEAMANIDTKLISVGKVIAVSGVAVEFKEHIQINIQNVATVDETQLEEYVVASAFSADAMWSELLQIIAELQNPYLKQMCETMFADTEVARKFKYWPAGLSYHHDFRSGLLQHVLECIAMAKPMARFYPDLDMDMVIASLILHDIGKIEELDADTITPRYSAKGSVLSHLYIGTVYVDRFLPAEAPEKLSWHLKHIILSHNGAKEKGAPVLPATAEAVFVSALDEASAQLNMGDYGVKQPANELGMTDYNRWLNRWMWAESKAG
jgi:3'-5' exoribonuclease